MNNYLEDKYKEVIINDYYIIAKGDLPICLVAHLDTFFENNEINEIDYIEDYDALIGKCGLGADDRAGVYAIISMIENGFRPSVIFTLGEEQGCVGARRLVKDYPNCPLENLKAIIEIDRTGYRNCAFYRCENVEFKKCILSYGLEEAIGSYSDISFLGPTWDVAAVNISCGYYNEHTKDEFLMIEELIDTIRIIKKILKDSRYFRKFDFY